MVTRNTLHNDIIGIDIDWEKLLYLGVLQEGESIEGVTYVTDGKKWGAMDLYRHPMIPIMYDFVNVDEYEYGCIHIVCGNNPFKENRRFDIYYLGGIIKQNNLTEYDNGNHPICMEMQFPEAALDKFFICLANSYKRGGRCIAGVEIVFNKDLSFSIVHNNDGSPHWIRPISFTQQYGEIPNDEASNIRLLSIVKLTKVLLCPKDAHSENVFYSQMDICKYDIPISLDIVKQLIDPIHQSIFHNRGKAVSKEMFFGIKYSLMLIHTENACAYIDESREKSKNRMSFTYIGADYDLPITDPFFGVELKKEPERYVIIPDIYLTLSLGLEFEGWHHKLVAGVIIPPVSSQNKDVENVSYMEQQKRLHNNAYAKWAPEDDEQLKILYKKGTSIQELTRLFGRNEGAIYSRINKLGLECERIVSLQTDKNWFDKYDQELARLLDKKNEIDEQINEVRAKILEQMESHGLEKIHSEQFSVSYTPAKTVMQFDSRTFRTENEELYTRYCKPKQREKSIVVKRNLNR